MDAVAGVVHPVHLEEVQLASVVASTHPDDHVVVANGLGSVGDEAIARAVGVLDRQPSVGIVFVTDQDTGDGVQRGHHWLRHAAAHGPDTVAGRGAVLRRTTFEDVGPQRLGTRAGRLSLWLRAAALADVAHVAGPRAVSPPAPPPGAHPACIGEITELHERAHAFLELFGGFAPLRGQVRLRTTTYKALARSARRRAWVAAYEGDRVEASLCLHLAHDVTSWRRQR